MTKNPSIVVVDDKHHYSEIDHVIDELKTRGVEKHIIVVDTDKHNRIKIVTPDFSIDIRTAKTKKEEEEKSSTIYLRSHLYDENRRHNLKLSHFDDSGRDETVIEVTGKRMEGEFKSWQKVE